MVKREPAIYLFIGEDSFSKDIQLKRLRQKYLPKEIEQFNLDILYAPGLDLKSLQEKLILLPANAKKRLVVIKEVAQLKGEVREFLLKYASNPYLWVILILDTVQKEPQDEFIARISKYACVYRFREAVKFDTFTLSRQIERRRPDYALRILNQLLQNGEKPERILGGLRYSWEKAAAHPLESKKRLKLLLNCDLEIKTGRLKPSFALEKLVVGLCGLSQSFG